MGMTRMVTPGYAPLEQYRGEARFGPTTDIYGLAATCYRLATGRVPVAAVERDAGGELPAPHRLNPAISKQVSDAILDGLELEPAHRPQDLDAFLARLGVRWLPDTPRSLLLGTRGAEPADLAPGPDHGSASEPQLAGGVGPPSPHDLPPMVDPGPAVPAAVAPSAATSVTPPVGVAPPSVGGDPGRVAEPVSRLATEIVPPPAPPVPATATAHLPPAPSPSALVGGPIDADRTWTPGDRRADDATRTPGAAWTDLPGEDRSSPELADPGPASVARPARPRLVTLPLAAFAVAAGSAAPLLVIGVVVLVVLPWLATLGDDEARRQRAERGFAAGRAERLPTGVVVPSRFVRNLVTSVLRTSPIVGVSAVFLGCWYALDQTSLPQGILDVLLRIIGGGAVWLVLLGAREGSPRFRSGLGIDRVVRRLTPEGRVSERVVVLWLLAAIGIAAALWLTPDAFPLR